MDDDAGDGEDGDAGRGVTDDGRGDSGEASVVEGTRERKSKGTEGEENTVEEGEA